MSENGLKNWYVLKFDVTSQQWVVATAEPNTEEVALSLRDECRQKGDTAIACTAEYLSDWIPSDAWGKDESMKG